MQQEKYTAYLVFFTDHSFSEQILFVSFYSSLSSANHHLSPPASRVSDFLSGQNSWKIECPHITKEIHVSNWQLCCEK